MLTRYRFAIAFGLALALAVFGLALRNAQLARSTATSRSNP